VNYFVQDIPFTQELLKTTTNIRKSFKYTLKRPKRASTERWRSRAKKKDRPHFFLREEIGRNGALRRESCLSEASSFSSATLLPILAKKMQP